MATATLTDPTISNAPDQGMPFGVPYRMTAEEFFKAVDADVFPYERRIELWEGRLFEKMARELPHVGGQTNVIVALVRVLPDGWGLWVEGPILVDDFSAPLPDVAIIQGVANDYTSRQLCPKVGEIGLVVEVADTSLRKNLTKTMEIYARAGLPTYWVINLVAKRVEVYSRPRVEGSVGSYEDAELFEPGKQVPLRLDGKEIARIPVNDLLPKEPS